MIFDILEVAFHAGPMIYSLGSSSGLSALKSQTTAAPRVVYAEDCKLFNDLILTSFAVTMNTLSDAAMTILPDRYGNLVTRPDRLPRNGVGDFVLPTPMAQTFPDGYVSHIGKSRQWGERWRCGTIHQ